jgi:Fur family ferric uptake transcriptional regulator
MVQKTDLRKGAACFELSKNHHHHITCTFCGTVEDFESISVERELKKIAATTSHFRQIKDHSLELFGVCNSCTTK